MGFDFQQLLNDVIRRGSKVYSGLNSLYNKADRAVGGNLPFGVAPTPIPKPTRTRSESQRGVINYLKEVPDKGLIPMPTFNPSNEAIFTAGKYALGPLGLPFRPLRNSESKERLQQQVDAASVRDGQLIYGVGEPGYESTRFPSNAEGAGIVGQFIGKPNANNQVVVSEPYDTKPVDWHANKFKERFVKGEFGGASESVGNMVFRALSDIGWANQYPRGTTQVVGELKPGHPLYRGPQ